MPSRAQHARIDIGAQQDAGIAHEGGQAADAIAAGPFRSASGSVRLRMATIGTGRNGSRRCATPTGPAPGPPPPCGVEKVLCRFMWITSKPMSPGLTLPRMALRLAPS